MAKALRGPPRPKIGRPRARSKTRAQKPLLIDDSTASEKELKDQLTRMELYAAPTVGDGNCLFRALSDQLYGSPQHFVQLREEVCDFIAQHRERFAPFLDEDEGLEAHLESMRLQGTWGTYIELSAFVNRFRRAIKVVQPGLVYVFPPDDDINATKGGSEHGEEDVEDMEESDGGGTDAKGKRTLRSEKHEEVVVVLALPEEEDPTPLYIAFHSWGHYSSLRNVAGPHTGIPHVREAPTASTSGTPPPPSTLTTVRIPKSTPRNAFASLPLPLLSPRAPALLSLSPTAAYPTPLPSSHSDASSTISSLPLDFTLKASPLPKRLAGRDASPARLDTLRRRPESSPPSSASSDPATPSARSSSGEAEVIAMVVGRRQGVRKKKKEGGAGKVRRVGVRRSLRTGTGLEEEGIRTLYI